MNTVKEIWENKEDYKEQKEPHMPPIPDYLLVSEYYANKKDFEGKDVIVGGYVSTVEKSVNSDGKEFLFVYIVERKEDVLDNIITEENKNENHSNWQNEVNRYFNNKNITLSFVGVSANDINPYDFLIVSGKAGEKIKNAGDSSHSVRNCTLIYRGDERPTIVDNNKEVYTISEYYDNLGYLKGETVKVEGYVSSKFRYAMNERYAYRVVLVENKDDILGYDFSNSSSSSSEKTAAQTEEEDNPKRLIIARYLSDKDDFELLNIGNHVIWELIASKEQKGAPSIIKTD